MEKLFQALNELIKSANNLGALSTAAILAFFCLVFLGYIIYTIRQQRIGSDVAWQARLKESEADAAMAKAIEQGFGSVVTEMREVRYEVRELQKIKDTNGDKHV